MGRGEGGVQKHFFRPFGPQFGLKIRGAYQYTECKYGGPLGRPRPTCAKARLVRPQEFCFDCSSAHALAIESIDMVCFELVRA